MMEYSWKSKIYTLISCVFFAAVWQSAAVLINNEIYIPKIQQVLVGISSIFKDESFLQNIFSSFNRTMVSYTLALVVAIILGVLGAVYPFFQYLMQPLNAFGKTIPTLVLVVLSLVWFDKDKTPYVVGFAIVFPILYEGIRNSILQIDRKIIDMTKIYEINLIDKVINIYLPVVKFYFMSIFVSTISLTFKVVIAGEVHGQPKFGIGSQIQLEKVNFNTSGIFAWIVIIVLISLILEFINSLLKEKIYRWSK